LKQTDKYTKYRTNGNEHQICYHKERRFTKNSTTGENIYHVDNKQHNFCAK